jgi:CRP-like cAMP-binding protein
MKKIELGDGEQAAFVRITKGISLFASGLSTSVMEKILACVKLYDFEPGERVVKQGDPGDAFFAVLAGSLKVSVREAFVFSKKVAALQEGEFFGEMALLDGAPRSATVTCETAAKLFVLRRDDFQSILKLNPEFAAEIRKMASDRFFELNAEK